MSPPLDATDRRLLDCLQDGLPLTSRPYAELGARLGLAEAAVLARVTRLLADGTIRRLGASLAARQLGGTTTLIGLRVRPAQVTQVAAQVNRFPEVTHNYERDDEFNLWFTVVAADPAAVARLLALVRPLPGVEELLELPAEQVFKLDTRFRFGDPHATPD